MTGKIQAIQDDLTKALKDLKHRGVRSPGSLNLLQKSIDKLKTIKQQIT
jgi:hypothetical protein